MQEHQDKKQVLAHAASTLLNEPTTITVDVLNPNIIQRFLMFCRVIPRAKVFKVKAACMGTMIRISSLLLEVDINVFKDTDNFLNTNYSLMATHGEAMCKIIAAAISNSEEEPPKSLVKFLLNNLTAAEMRTIFTVVLHKINIEDFMFSIMSSTGMNLMNPKE